MLFCYQDIAFGGPSSEGLLLLVKVLVFEPDVIANFLRRFDIVNLRDTVR